jgi:hypothetical protein
MLESIFNGKTLLMFSRKSMGSLLLFSIPNLLGGEDTRKQGFGLAFRHWLPSLNPRHFIRALFKIQEETTVG